MRYLYLETLLVATLFLDLGRVMEVLTLSPRLPNMKCLVRHCNY